MTHSLQLRARSAETIRAFPDGAQVLSAGATAPPRASSRRSAGLPETCIRQLNKGSVMSEKEPCAFCGDEHWTEAHFTAGRLVCRDCWSGRNPPAAMPCTPTQRAQFDLWLASKVPAKALALNLAQATQPQGAICG
jgi:hypothetical protein